MIRILLADDHRIFRQGVREILESETDLTVRKEADTGREAIEAVLADDCDVALIDISMPDYHGLDVLKQIKQAHPDMAVIILSMHPENQYCLRALRAGAAGYLTKECAAEELIAAIRKVHKGGMYVTSAVTDLLTGDMTGRNNAAPHENLTDREYQVLAMIAAGAGIRTIADRLGLSPGTVSTYRTRLLRKLGLSTNEDLYTYAMDHGILD